MALSEVSMARLAEKLYFDDQVVMPALMIDNNDLRVTLQAAIQLLWTDTSSPLAHRLGLSVIVITGLLPWTRGSPSCSQKWTRQIKSHGVESRERRFALMRRKTKFRRLQVSSDV